MATPVWTVPGERMKGKKAADVQPHRVPLSAAAVEVLARAYTWRPATAAKPRTCRGSPR